MRKGIAILVILSFYLYKTTEAQIRIFNSTSNSAATGSSAFIDASSNNTVNSSTNIGKGLLFPKTDLTTFTTISGTPTGMPFSYPTRFDGMIVYNTASGTAAIGSKEVSPGFYYYENKTTNVDGGSWIRLTDGNDSSGGTDVVYYGVIANTNPASADITGLTIQTTLSGSYDGKFNQTVSTEGYFTVAIPVAWRNPLLTIDGNETFNIFLPVKILDINGKSYQVWQSDVSFVAGITIAIN